MLAQRPIIRFWSRKPFNSCGKYITKYSKIDDIVLDCFGGSGSIIQAALLHRRKAIYIDANPYAWLIAYVTIRGVDDVDKYLEAANKIMERKRIYYVFDNEKHWIPRTKLYQVHCPRCGEVKNVKYYKWRNRKCYAILTCGHVVDSRDFNASVLPRYFYPRKAPLYYDNGVPFDKRRNVDFIHELFTKRNLLLLSTLLYDIDNVSKKYPVDIALALYFTFAAILFSSSSMAREGAGSWGVPSYWVPETHLERNPYELFERKAKSLARYFTELNELKRKLDYRVTTSIKDVIEGKYDVAISIGNAMNLNEVPDESIDLIFTDPPHTDEVQYFELSYFYWSWLTSSKRFINILEYVLGFKPTLDFNVELSVNIKRGKTLKEYLKGLQKSINEFHRVVKSGKYVILFFHEENPKIKLNIIKMLSQKFTIKDTIQESIRQRNIGKRNSLGSYIDIIILLKHY